MTTDRPEEFDMSLEQFRRIEEIFHQASDLPSEARSAYLDHACADDSGLRAQLEALLAQDDPDQSLAELRLRVETAASPIAGPPAQDPMLGRRVGRYRIDSVIAVGGMGAVYAAEQEQPRRAIALKLIKPGHFSDTARRRFEFEAEILGRLQHPAIGQIIEAGTFDAGAGVQPFFAMEFIRGKSLTEFASEKELNIRLRFELLAKVCEGVHHAHQKGIIHRDLKPGNILVDSHSQPKILDFGVARATDSDVQTTTRDTHTGQLIGTLPYMSPEQTAGDPNDIDARSDVYALGVVAYELLAGRLPYDLHGKALPDAVRMIREDDPTPLSSIPRCGTGVPPVNRRGTGVPPVDRDVEHMVTKALAKEKERRYQSANEFARDIRRYLNDEPIEARPPSATYKLRKFTKRNKVLVGGVAAVFVTLVLGIVFTQIARADEAEQRRNAQMAEREQNRARQEAEDALQRETAALKEAERDRNKAETITELVTKALVSSDPNQQGMQDFKVVDAMDQTIALLDAGELKDQPETEAALRLTIAAILNGNARSAVALRLAEQALETDQKLHPGDHPNLAESLNSVALCLESLGRAAAALPKYEAALGMRQRLFEGDHPSVAQSLNNLAACLDALGRWAEALPKFEAALGMRQRLFQRDHPDVALSLNNLGHCLQSLGRFDDALPKSEAALEMRRRLYEGDHPRVATSLNNLGLCLQYMDRSDEALPKLEAALEMDQRLFEGDHPRVAVSLNNVAFCLRSLGRSDEALPKFEAAMEMFQRLFEGDHPKVATSLNNVALCLDSLGRSDEALLKYEAAMEMFQRLFEGDHPHLAQALYNVASCLRSLGRSAEALPKYEAALEMLRRVLPPGHPNTLYPQIGLAGTLEALGRYAEAEPLLRDAAEQCQRSEASRRLFWHSVLKQSAALYDTWHAAEPDAGYDAKAAEWRGKLPAAERAGSLIKLGKRLLEDGRHAQAEAALRECLEIRQEALAEGHWLIFNTMSVLGESLTGQGVEPSLALRARIEKLREAEPLLLEGYEGIQDHPEGPDVRKREALERIVKLYEAWHAAEPEDEGAHGRDAHATKAAEWRAKLEEEGTKATRQERTKGKEPASQPAAEQAESRGNDPK